MMATHWRIEADDEWLATHRSTAFIRLRRRARLLGLVGEAVSHAETGPFGGAPRNPRLKIGDKAYAVVRYARHNMAYTAVSVEPGRCRRCGQELIEVHRILYARGQAVRTPVGQVRTCRSCQAESWMFYSRMPTVRRFRDTARKTVL